MKPNLSISALEHLADSLDMPTPLTISRVILQNPEDAPEHWTHQNIIMARKNHKRYFLCLGTKIWLKIECFHYHEDQSEEIAESRYFLFDETVNWIPLQENHDLQHKDWKLYHTMQIPAPF